MNTDKLAINWQNFARVRLQLKFAFIIRPKVSYSATTDLGETNCGPINVSYVICPSLENQINETIWVKKNE